MNIIVSNEYEGYVEQICPFPHLNANIHTFQDVRDKCFMILYIYKTKRRKNKYFLKFNEL